MRTSLGSNLSLEAEAGLICPIHTPSTSPLPAVPTSPLPTPASLLDHPGVQGTCQAASYLVHYYSSFKSAFGTVGIPPGWVISLLRACTTLTVTVHFTWSPFLCSSAPRTVSCLALQCPSTLDSGDTCVDCPASRHANCTVTTRWRPPHTVRSSWPCPGCSSSTGTPAPRGAGPSEPPPLSADTQGAEKHCPPS